MPRLSAVCLSVSNPAQLARFYVDHLGMTAREGPAGWRLGYAGSDADLLLMPGGGGYSHTRDDLYWKIGLTLPNVDIAHAQLSAAGLSVSKPHQFRDIGYMCHLSDPEGFQIELLQHSFEGHRPAGAGDPALSLGGGARIGQITLRSADIETTSAQAKQLGMRLLSVQPVTDLGFTLYFWAFTDEIPPAPDPEAVENRPWLWQRPYTTLEIQHRPGAAIRPSPAYQGIEIADMATAPGDAFGGPIRA